MFSLYFGQTEFGGYDASMLVDAGWRMALHQQPYRDFPNLLPPLFLLSAGASVRIFGDHWRSFTLGEDCLYLLAAGAGWALVRFAPQDLSRSDGRRYAPGILAAYLLAISLPHLVTSHLWHAVDTSILATTLLLAFTLRALEDEVFTPPIFQTVAILVSAAVWLGKPNLAISAQVVTLFFSACSKSPLRQLFFWLTTTFAGFMVAVTFLLACGFRPWTVAFSYTKFSGRPSPAVLLALFSGLGISAASHVDAMLSYTFVLAVPVVLLVGVWLHRQNRALHIGIPLVLAGGVLTTVGMLTNWDIRTNDVAPLFFAAAFACLPLFPALTRAENTWRTILLVLLAECVVLCGFSAQHRTRMISVGDWAGLVFGDLQTRNDPFFGHFAARQVFWDGIIDPIDRDRHLHPGTNVFFGERLEFEYARLHLNSPTLLPVWWHAGSSYPIAIQHHLGDEWAARHFQTVYISTFDRMPQRLADELASHYTLDSSAGSVVKIYRRRPNQCP